MVCERKGLKVTPHVNYEVVVTTYNEDSSPHIASMGAVFSEEADHYIITLRPHVESTTYKNLASRRCGVVNVVDPMTLVECALDLGVLEFEFEEAKEVRAPKLTRAEAWLEFEVDDLRIDGIWAVTRCRTVSVEVSEVYVEPYTRSAAALVEAAVHASRIKPFEELGDKEKVEELKGRTKYYVELASRLGKGSLAERMAAEISKRFL